MAGTVQRKTSAALTAAYLETGTQTLMLVLSWQPHVPPETLT